MSRPCTWDDDVTVVGWSQSWTSSNGVYRSVHITVCTGVYISPKYFRHRPREQSNIISAILKVIAAMHQSFREFFLWVWFDVWWVRVSTNLENLELSGNLVNLQKSGNLRYSQGIFFMTRHIFRHLLIDELIFACNVMCKLN